MMNPILSGCLGASARAVGQKTIVPTSAHAKKRLCHGNDFEFANARNIMTSELSKRITKFLRQQLVCRAQLS